MLQEPALIVPGTGRREAEAPDLAAERFGEPYIAVWPRRDAERAGVRGRHRELGDPAGRRDPPDFVSPVLGEPEVAVRTDRDAGNATALCRNGELVQATVRSHLRDVVAVPFGEPEIAVRAVDDVIRKAVPGGHGELRLEVF